MRKPMVVVGVAALLTFGAGVGAAVAQTGERDTRPPVSSPSMDATHAGMRAAMPADVAAECDAMHAQMSGAMGSMMGDPSTTESVMGTTPSAVSAADHASHHAP